jgi:ATP-dependent Clp protease ATP-binding subunit ClpX
VSKTEQKWPELLSSKDIKTHLDKFIKGQDEAVDLLSYIGRMYLLQLLAIKLGVRKESLPRLNLLISAPTGIGKTFLVKKFAEAMGVGYYRIDCSSTKAEGWHGTNLSDQLYNYLQDNQSGHGVLHLDEIDKVANGEDDKYANRLDLQANFLDILNGEYSHIHQIPGHSKGVDLSAVNLSLVILSGSFQSFRNNTKKNIGFVQEAMKKDKEHFLQQGFIQEFEARILHSIELNMYNKDQILDIIQNSEDSPYKKYVQFLGPKYMLNQFDLHRLADKTLTSKNGLRDLETELFKEYYRKDKVK